MVADRWQHPPRSATHQVDPERSSLSVSPPPGYPLTGLHGEWHSDARFGREGTVEAPVEAGERLAACPSVAPVIDTSRLDVLERNVFG
jgi:hypothetical protein